MVTCNILQIYGWIRYPEPKFWGVPFGSFSQIGTIIHLILIVAFPLVGGTKIWWNHESLDKPDTLVRYGVFYEEIRKKTRS